MENLEKVIFQILHLLLDIIEFMLWENVIDIFS